jgi:hypothetical protein
MPEVLRIAGLLMLGIVLGILSPVFEHGIELYGHLSPVGIQCLTPVSTDPVPPSDYRTATQLSSLFTSIPCSPMPPRFTVPSSHLRLASQCQSPLRCSVVDIPFSVYIVNATIQIHVFYSSILAAPTTYLCSLHSGLPSLSMPHIWFICWKLFGLSDWMFRCLDVRYWDCFTITIPPKRLLCQKRAESKGRSLPPLFNSP